MMLNYADLSEGMEIPEAKKGPITREQLVDYASSSGDYNKIHYDESFAQKAKLGGCIAHGMLVMAMVGSYIKDWAENGILKNFQIRFTGMTKENDTLTFKGKISRKFEENGEDLIEVEVMSLSQEGNTTTTGSAILKI